MLQIAKPWLLLTLLFIPLYWLIKRYHIKKHQLRLPFSKLGQISMLSSSSRYWAYFYPVLRSLILLALVLALIQPRFGRGIKDSSSAGVDIVLALDISGSMLAEDFKPTNRLKAAVKVAEQMVKQRPNDRFSLVAFSEYALTQSPLTFDHAAVLDQLGKLEVNMQASGTAIGMGLAKSVARLKSSQAKSKAIILITDGVNNIGEIDPISAAHMASAHKIKVYPVGVGSGGLVDFPFEDPIFGKTYRKTYIELDMHTLDRIAQITGTKKASMATNSEELAEIMSQIDEMEKTDYQVRLNYIYSEKFMWPLWIAFCLLVIEIFCRLYLKPVLPEP
ncbi:MAG TPA: VWA domain-containing protein [Candidatus Cloacimonetes bacterium]|jgi:Ca-activated chloride channel family protein|nr:aerotolerance regulator BatA [Candidatus Cloacimonas sp.]HHZ15291.1 VWA domain-containing protein [Candidatus Cloacimonadota bacterium]